MTSTEECLSSYTIMNTFLRHRDQFLSDLIKVASVALVYFVSARVVSPLSLSESESVFAIWPPTGIALSAFFIFGKKIWPGIFIGAFVLNYTLTPFAPSAQIAITNTLGPWIGFQLLVRFADQAIFESLRNMVTFFVIIIVASIVTAAGGGFALWLHGFVRAEDLFTIWSGWFLGDLIGFLLIPPLVSSLRTERKSFKLIFSFEGFFMLGSLMLIGAITFGPLEVFDMVEFPGEYFLLPPLIWVALRFGPFMAVIALMSVAFISIGGTIFGYGPFIRSDPNHSLLLLQSFNGILSVTILLMASIIREKEVAWKAERESNDRAIIEQSKLALVGEMVGAIAHQWRQPLNALGVNIQLIQDEYEYGELNRQTVDEKVADSMRQIEYMSHTIDDFRNFVKPSREKSSFLLGHAIQSSVNLVYIFFKNKNIDICLEEHTSTEKNIQVMGVSNEFSQSIINILNNAKDAILDRKKNYVEFTDRGKIIITIDMENSYVRITIEDNGGGISEEILDQVFEPYMTTKGKNGTGIGLSMAKTLIENTMGGNISVENGREGARFIIRLPVSGKQES